MSRTDPAEVEHEELRYACGKCGQPPDEWCITSGGRYSGYLHSDRYYQWWRERTRRDGDSRRK